MANLKDLIVNGSARILGKLFAQTPTEPTNNNEVATTAFVKNNTVTKTLDGTSKKTWIGTSAKYETDKASGLITNTTECLITDDEQELALGVDTYTKEEIDDKIRSSYYIGQTIFSLDPLNYASLRLLDGSLLQVGGVYDEFISKYIDPLFKKHPNRFISESEWQQQVSTYGACGKYVYTEGVAVRLPKVTGIVEGTIDPSALGDLVEAGLPNIKGTFYVNTNGDEEGTNGTGAFSVKQSGTQGVANDGALSTFVTFNASQSNPIYDNSTTVQPQTIKGYYYIVVATGIDEEVNLKFDTLDIDYARSDLSNLTEEGKEQLISGISYVVEISGNSTKGYRLWSDGYCEQWGQLSSTASNAGTATLPKPYKDNNYILIAQSATTAAKDSSLSMIDTSRPSNVSIFAKSTSSISLAAHGGGQIEVMGAATILYHTFGYVS